MGWSALVVRLWRRSPFGTRAIQTCIELSTEALELIRRRGGRAAIDFIPPIG